MVKQIFHRVFSSLMALLVLLSTVSFTIEKHFCGDTLVDVAVFSEIQHCGMDMVLKKATSIQKETCCKNELEFLKGQDGLIKKSFEDLSISKQLFFATLVQSYLHLFEGLPEPQKSHNDYSPPILVTDIHLLDQVFII